MQKDFYNKENDERNIYNVFINSAIEPIKEKNRIFSTFDMLRTVDYVITDYSALAIDACVLNKKLLLYVYDYEKCPYEVVRSRNS